MKKSVKAAIAALVAAALVLTLVFALPRLKDDGKDYVSAAEDCTEIPESWDRVIAYVPLDDRTDNVDNVIYQAEAAGYRIVMPEKDLYHTALDGQATNSNGTQYGNREALLGWVKDMDERGCDLFLLSLDQLLSGGLVNSRSLSESLPLDFDGESMSEDEAFDEFILTLGEDENNRIYLFDSVMRLASTVGYQGYDIEEYTAIRAYGKVARPILTGDELTLDNIFTLYSCGEDGSTPAESYVSTEDGAELLADDVISAYLDARERKLTLLDHVMGALADEEGFTLLVGIDDATNTANIQTNELAYIKKNLGDNAVLISGLDCLARLLLVELAQDDYNYGIKASVTYFGGSESLPPSDYDSYTMEEVVKLHMELFGASFAEEDDAELQIVVMTAPMEEGKKQEYCDGLIAKLKYNEENNIPTIFIEASNNAYGEALENEIVGSIDLARLVAFSGKYYQANVIGTGFAMGFSRYLYLQCCEDKSADCDLAHVRQLTLSSELCYAYAIHSRPELAAEITEMGYNYNNIICPETDMERISESLELRMNDAGAAILDNLSHGFVISDLSPYTLRELKEVSAYGYTLPWNRTFELTFNIDVSFKN